MFHTGRHEPDGLPDVEHVHGDPFTAEGIAAALGDRAFDVTVATYGRVRLLAAHLAHRTGQLVAVGGVPVYRGYAYPQTMRPTGMRLPVTEDHPLVAPDEPTPEGGAYGVAPIRRTEDALFALAADGAFRATVFRYPTIYGPRNPAPVGVVGGQARARRPALDDRPRRRALGLRALRRPQRGARPAAGGRPPGGRRRQGLQRRRRAGAQPAPVGRADRGPHGRHARGALAAGRDPQPRPRAHARTATRSPRTPSWTCAASARTSATPR